MRSGAFGVLCVVRVAARVRRGLVGSGAAAEVLDEDGGVVTDDRVDPRRLVAGEDDARHKEGDQIFAIKASQDRFLCFFFSGKKIIITNAYEKKTEKMPKSQKEKALKAKCDYMKRYKSGEYYE